MITKKQYSQIYKYAKHNMQRTKDLKHRWDHVLRVKENAIKIIKILGLEAKVDLRVLKICCLLHDVAYIYKELTPRTYFFEGTIAKNKVSMLLKQFDIEKADRKKIEYAVKVHHLSFPFAKLNRDKDIYTKVLQDADTIDYFSDERIKLYEEDDKNSLWEKIKYFFVIKVTEYGKRNIEDFLNYPKLSKYFYPIQDELLNYNQGDEIALERQKSG